MDLRRTERSVRVSVSGGSPSDAEQLSAILQYLYACRCYFNLHFFDQIHL